MGPRLAPLALLLLALCGITSAAVQKPSLPTLDNTVKKNAENAMHKYMSLFAAALDDTLTGDVKKVVDNGVLCAFTADSKLDESLKTALYAAVPPVAGAENAFVLASILNAVLDDCSTIAATDPITKTPEFKCVCTDKKVALYCAAEKYMLAIAAGTPPACPKDELAKIKAVSDKLAEFYDAPDAAKLQEMKGLVTENDVAKLTTKADAKFYCATLEDEVAASFEKLPANDFFYYLAVQNEDISAHCDSDEKKKTWFGECACPLKKDASFCTLRAQAQYFKEEGFLSCCKGDEKFIADKKPTGPFVKDAAKKATPVAPAECAVVSTTTQKPKETKDSDAAATAFSLLAPASALAAALVLRP